MALFSRRRQPPSPVASTPGCSVLDAHLITVGDLETDGTLRIDGALRGSITRADLVILGETARVEGDITAREVIVGGTVLGDVDASERVELQPTCVVTGDIATGAVLIHEGGVVRGRLIVRTQEDHARAIRPTPHGVRLVSATPDDTIATASSGLAAAP